MLLGYIFIFGGLTMRKTKEQRELAVKRYLSGERAMAITTEMGISRSALYLWIKQFREVQNENANFISIVAYKRLQGKVKRLEEIIQIYKTLNCNYNSSLKEKLYALEELYGQHSVHILCEALDVSRGTFYNHILRNKKQNTVYVQRKEELREKIQKIYDDSNQIFGAGKIMAVLKEQGIKAGEKTVRLLMRDMGIKSIRQEAKSLYDKEKKRNRNLLQQQFNPLKPNQVWVSDITMYRLKEKNFYICVILDLYSRAVVGYKIGIKNSTQLTKSTFKIAYINRQPQSGLMFHSDNGGNYCCKTFQTYLIKLNVEQSFSRPYVPYDNSVMESFFASMKREELYRRKFKSENEFYKAVADYIIFYNEKRPHYQNSYRTPLKKEQDYYNSVEQK